MISKQPDFDARQAGSGAPPPAPVRRHSRLPSLALGGMAGLIVVVIGIVVFMVVMRQSSPRLTQADYDAAVERWKQHGPASYQVDLELTGNRPGKIRVEVRDGEVVHMTRDGVEPSQHRTWDYWSVPGQFDTIGEELDMARDPGASFHNPRATEMVMWAEFDPRYGYPAKYDRVVLGADFEVHWKVTQFQVLTGKK